MSLTLFRPSVDISLYSPSREQRNDEVEQIFSLRDFRETWRTDSAQRTRLRAKLERANRSCSCCQRATVEPVENDDSLLNRQGHVIPRSASLAGFSCWSCGYQWRTPQENLEVSRTDEEAMQEQQVTWPRLRCV